MPKFTGSSQARLSSRSASLSDRRWCVSLAKTYHDPVVGFDLESAEEAARWKFDLHDVILLDGEPVAYICASVTRLQMHSKQRVLKMVYFHSVVSGILAARVLVYAHRLLVAEACRRRLRAAVTSSLNNNWQTMYRLLERDGWQQAGAIMYFRSDKCASSSSS